MHNFRSGIKLHVLRARSLVQLRWTRDDGRWGPALVPLTAGGGGSGVIGVKYYCVRIRTLASHE